MYYITLITLYNKDDQVVKSQLFIIMIDCLLLNTMIAWTDAIFHLKFTNKYCHKQDDADVAFTTTAVLTSELPSCNGVVCWSSRELWYFGTLHMHVRTVDSS